MELQVVEHSESLSHVALVGKLDIAGVQQVERAFSLATSLRHKPTIVDMAGVDFLASLGMGMLVDAAKTLRRNQIHIVLVQVKPMVKQALESAQLQQVLPMFEDVPAAKAYLGLA